MSYDIKVATVLCPHTPPSSMKETKKFTSKSLLCDQVNVASEMKGQLKDRDCGVVISGLEAVA
jgi:hypothetical protein